MKVFVLSSFLSIIIAASTAQSSQSHLLRPVDDEPVGTSTSSFVPVVGDSYDQKGFGGATIFVDRVSSETFGEDDDDDNDDVVNRAFVDAYNEVHGQAKGDCIVTDTFVESRVDLPRDDRSNNVQFLRRGRPTNKYYDSISWNRVEFRK